MDGQPLPNVEHMQATLRSAGETLALRRDQVQKAENAVVVLRQEVEKYLSKLRQADVQLGAARKSVAGIESRLKEKARGLADQVSAVAQQEASFKARHEERQKVHKDCIERIFDQRTSLRQMIASAEVDERFALRRLNDMKNDAEIAYVKEYERSQLRARLAADHRADDIHEFDSRYGEVYKLKRLGHDAEMEHMRSELRAAEAQLQVANEALESTNDKVDRQASDCTDISRELLAFHSLEERLREMVREGDSMQHMEIARAHEIESLAARLDERIRQLNVLENDRQREEDADRRIGELVAAVDSVREKLAVSREQRDLNRARRNHNADSRESLRRQIRSAEQELRMEEESFLSKQAAAKDTLERLAGEANLVNAKLRSARERLETTTVEEHRCKVELERVRRKDEELRELTRRSVEELRRSAQY